MGGNYSYGDPANQFSGTVKEVPGYPRKTRIAILNNDNSSNLMTIDIMYKSPATESYKNALISFLQGN